MTQIKQIWKCNICGNIVEVVHEGADNLVCCGEPMQVLTAKSREQEGKEKHIPVIEKNTEGVVVKIGSVPHPMEEKHYIEWIEISTTKGSSKKFLKPGEKPEVKFPIKTNKEIQAREYCNIHGLWSSE